MASELAVMWLLPKSAKDADLPERTLISNIFKLTNLFTKNNPGMEDCKGKRTSGGHPAEHIYGWREAWEAMFTTECPHTRKSKPTALVTALWAPLQESTPSPCYRLQKGGQRSQNPKSQVWYPKVIKIDREFWKQRNDCFIGFMVPVIALLAEH